MAGLLRRIRKKLERKIDLNPGEFEVLTTKAQRDWYEQGTLVMTNYRLFWFSQQTTGSATIEIDLQKVLGCVETRSWYYLLARPALRILLVNGKSAVFHAIQDFGGVKSNIERFMGQDRYTPGTLFSNS